MISNRNSTLTLGDLSTAVAGDLYESKRRECDPKGHCIHGFELHKPCIPCQRRGDALCCLCYDFGAIVMPHGETVDCFCKLGDE